MQIRKMTTDSIWFLNGLMLGIATMIIGLVLFSNWVHAATYNVLFNNVEQGANGVANPRVDVANGKATKSPDGTVPADAATAANPEVNGPGVGGPAPVTPVVSSATSETTAAAVAPTPGDHAVHPMRVGFFASNLAVNRSNDNASPVGGNLSLGFFPLRDFGLNFFAGTAGTSPHAFYGGELEFIPIRVGVFGANNAIEVKGMLGATTLGRELGVRDERGSVIGGVGATINFGDRYGISAEVRTNLSNRDDYKFTLADAGLTVRF
jgi:hypothetical protein